MKKGIRLPSELSYNNRLRNELTARILYNKEVKATDTTRFYAYIIIPDFGLYSFSEN
jgi:hypothetical protein